MLAAATPTNAAYAPAAVEFNGGSIHVGLTLASHILAARVTFVQGGHKAKRNVLKDKGQAAMLQGPNAEARSALKEIRQSTGSPLASPDLTQSNEGVLVRHKPHCASGLRTWRGMSAVLWDGRDADLQGSSPPLVSLCMLRQRQWQEHRRPPRPARCLAGQN